MDAIHRVELVRGHVVLACAALIALAGCESSDDERESFSEPPSITSSNGELQAAFTVAETTVQVADRNVRAIVYNGEYMPPLLRVRPGDVLQLDLNNQTAEPTNEHYHGMNVSPRINVDTTISDNVLISVEPGTQVRYRVNIPGTHNPGLYWYHAHLHGFSERQIMGGLSGGLVVEGILDPFPELTGIRERVILLKDIQITSQGMVPDDIDPSADTNHTVNGLTHPTIRIEPGELQFWRFANIGSDIYYRIVLDGHTFYELARDGNRHNQLVPMEEIFLPPASRSEVFVRGETEGRHRLRTLAFDTGPVGDSYDAADLATVITRGEQRRESLQLPQSMPVVEDFRTLPIARQRTITFSEDDTGSIFYVDSGDGPKLFDINRVDSTIPSGTVEEWTVNNASEEMHVFHIHQTDFQVTEIDGVPQEFVGHQDTVNVGYQHDDGSPGQVKIIIDFRNPNIVGKFVYHCHILEHEDGGMMAIAEVVTPPGALSPLDARAARGPLDPAVTASSLEAFQAGSYCSAPAPRLAADGTALASLLRNARTFVGP